MIDSEPKSVFDEILAAITKARREAEYNHQVSEHSHLATPLTTQDLQTLVWQAKHDCRPKERVGKDLVDVTKEDENTLLVEVLSSFRPRRVFRRFQLSLTP
jgi:hypothetical protein